MLEIKKITDTAVTLSFFVTEPAEQIRILYADRASETQRYEEIYRTDRSAGDFTFAHVTDLPLYFRLERETDGNWVRAGEAMSPVHFVRRPQMEHLNRGLIALSTNKGVFLSWRLLRKDVTGYDREGQNLLAPPFAVYRNGIRIAEVTESCSYLDVEGKSGDRYAVQRLFPSGTPAEDTAVMAGDPISEEVRASEKSYLEIPLQKPAPGVTPAGDAYEYSANDMAVADVDGDGEYEYIIKWDPSNATDVSIKGYTGPCILDCCRLDGSLLWRLDLGPNIRAGAHYTQFMVCDFDGDGKAELNVKTAPGTRMTVYSEDGSIQSRRFITMPEEDRKKYSHSDHYACSAKDYEQHLIDVFMHWQDEPEVRDGHWPKTLEECFHISQRFEYPLSQKDAAQLVNYFLDVYAPQRSSRNDLRRFEGFIYEGPEYLTMFAGDGTELETIPFPFPRLDDGLRWGDYAMKRIEPCNRVDRFLSGVAYLDGMHPYLIICRGYYTRTCIAAYRFQNGHFSEYWKIDSGFVPMTNPFDDHPHTRDGSDPVYGTIASQGNHSLSTADVDGDGCMEIIYGGACIDHDGSVLYSGKGMLPDGTIAKLGHGDAMHVGCFDPDRPGQQIFSVFEGAKEAPYGYALRNAKTGKVDFGRYAEEDLGRCMVGDIDPARRGYSMWINDLAEYDCHGKLIRKDTLGSNMSIRYASDYSTQIVDGVNYLDTEHHPGTGVINDRTHGVMLRPQGTRTNNGTKGNPCLVADIFGDYREEILLRTQDSSAIRIYTNTEVSDHRMICLMEDMQYRCGTIWQNNCYNQPCYPSFYYGSDMDAAEVLPGMKQRPVLWIAGDSLAQSYSGQKADTETGMEGTGEKSGVAKQQRGWGEYLLRELTGGSAETVGQRAGALNPHERRYTSGDLAVDNCAMGARSSRTFREEGRLKEIGQNWKPGDYLLIQFGHNDADSLKSERYVAPEDFAGSLQKYLDEVRKSQAVPILLTPVPFEQNDHAFTGEAEIVHQGLPVYAEIMRELSLKEDVMLVDVYALGVQKEKKLSPMERAKLHMQDHVHLTDAGAAFYAGIIADQIRRIIYREA